MGAIIFICVVLIVFMLVLGLWNDARRTQLVHEGKATYFVRIAASGKGQVYHSYYRCASKVACVPVTLSAARERGYRPCATCRGEAAIRLLDGSSC